MTKPIPADQRLEMSEDPFYKHCCISDDFCEGVIQWHHHFKWVGKRTDDKFGILPVCEYHHKLEGAFKGELDRVMLNRMTDEELKKYSKAINYVKEKERLNNKYAR